MSNPNRIQSGKPAYKWDAAAAAKQKPMPGMRPAASNNRIEWLYAKEAERLVLVRLILRKAAATARPSSPPAAKVNPP
ncbi:hypothetical protein ZHAS_00016170 [Anopheles sinensis]|uniref:Uncharacterized protein n=1 Tax=Anopheles sinensis TaxID=74873 RepID=A0A084WCV4_ANOSI|nr:hypothetical protein ZHAS_00016170 [Anopheles sinensis]